QRGGVARNGDRLDHIRVKGALRQELRLARPPGRLLKDFNEGPADDFPFALRVADVPQPFQEQFRGLLALQLELKVAAEHLPYRLGFAGTEQAVVDENAGE